VEIASVKKIGPWGKPSCAGLQQRQVGEKCIPPGFSRVSQCGAARAPTIAFGVHTGDGLQFRHGAMDGAGDRDLTFGVRSGGEGCIGERILYHECLKPLADRIYEPMHELHDALGAVQQAGGDQQFLVNVVDNCNFSSRW
jgi:hypothetical protein